MMQLIGYLINIFLLMGLYLAIPTIATLTVVYFIFTTFTLIVGCYGIEKLKGNELREIKDGTSLAHILLGFILIGCWFHVLSYIGAIGLLYYYSFNTLLSILFLIRLYTKSEY